MHKYDHHIGDYDRDTGHLTLLEHGVYRRLLDRYYADEGLTENVAQLARKIRAISQKEKKAVQQVLNEFFVFENGRYQHARCDEELSNAKTRTLKARYSQLLRWWKESEWGPKPSYETYTKDIESYHCPITNHIRKPYDRITDVSAENTILPPSAFPQPPSATINPHTTRAGARADGVWPDPREYPTLDKVKTWAVAVMAPPECAEKWHAEKTAEGWLNRYSQPYQCDESVLRPLFTSYATAWKAQAAKGSWRNGNKYGKRPANADDMPPASSLPGYVEPVLTAEDLQPF